MMQYVLNFCIVLFAVMGSLLADLDQKDSSKYFVKGKCKGLWRPEKLQGRCFGLKTHNEYPELKDTGEITSAEDCRSLCCNLGSKCVSWQYQSSTKRCGLGGVMRLGTEVTGTPDWCDPYAPAKWSGNRLLKREGGKCTWGEAIPNQCFGLGPERKGATDKSYTTEECAAACCAASHCEMWQEQPGRGCYFESSKGVWCEETKLSAYEGGRKCIPGFCGPKVLEDEILTRFNKTHSATSAASHLKWR